MIQLARRGLRSLIKDNGNAWRRSVVPLARCSSRADKGRHKGVSSTEIGNDTASDLGRADKVSGSSVGVGGFFKEEQRPEGEIVVDAVSAADSSSPVLR